jgi:hypothetical protein
MKALLEATIEAISTRVDNTISIKIGTQELAPEMCVQLFQMRNKLVKILISDTNITKLEEELIDYESLVQVKKGKTSSQRLRGVLFRINEHNGGNEENFEAFYKSEMERIIEHYKLKLD